MKTLVIQLARLGDIYQTWPVLHALRRQNPNMELHFLTREKFAHAAPGVEVISRHWLLKSRDILAPLIDEKPNLDESLGRLSGLVEELKSERFDQIINLSFSPLSSYLTQEISALECDLRGYTRFSDGYLRIPDDASAYFYAQVGPENANRIHVTKLFSLVAGVESDDTDWSMPIGRIDSSVEASCGQLSDAVVIHIGASDLRKTLSWTKWAQVIRGLRIQYSGPVILIGSSEEASMAEQVVSSLPQDLQPVNLVGKTQITDLNEIIRQARLVIGGDSAPAQIASLTGTPVLNISFPMVSFWETGPLSRRSRIFLVENEESVLAAEIVDEALAILEGLRSPKGLIESEGPSRPYLERTPHQERFFEWEFLRALYMGESFPLPPAGLYLEGMRRLSEVVVLAREQIDSLRKQPENKTSAAILERADEIIDQLARMVPELTPLVGWYKTEKLRIGPMPLTALIEATDKVYSRLGQIVDLYMGEQVNDNVVLG